MAETNVFVDAIHMPYTAANGGDNRYFRNGKQNTFTFPMGVLKAKEGWIAIQAPGQGPDSAWGRLCAAIGREDLVDDPRYLTDQDRIARSEALRRFRKNPSSFEGPWHSASSRSRRRCMRMV